MKQEELFKAQAQELKGNYEFRSPYHKSKKMLPFSVHGTVAANRDFPIEVFTVSYRGWDRQNIHTSYKYGDIKEMIDSGKLVKV